MIRVRDWIPSVPDEEKHIAYVGEGRSVTKEFLLCGDGWEAYQNWNFHLDMAFDPESITTRDNRQVVQTRVNSTEMKEEAAVTRDETVTKETYTVENEDVLDFTLTDVAPMEKHITDEGIRLVWTVLRQQTMLPGKLWATLRAVSSDAEQVKKSDIMVFEVGAAISATPAARPPISEMEQIEARISTVADTVTYHADRAEAAVRATLDNVYICNDIVADMQKSETAVLESVQEAAEYAGLAQGCVQAVEQMQDEVEDTSETIAEYAEIATEARGVASQCANSAVEAYRGVQRVEQNISEQAEKTAINVTMMEEVARSINESVYQAYDTMADMIVLCSQYAQDCENTAKGVDQKMGAVDNLTYRRVNVRDCGAVGDGIADDRAAIIAAFEQAKTMLPCEVYFPAGIYGISNGITVEMAYGTGGLKVCGAGRDVTTIRYLDSYDPDQPGNMWYAIRIWPVGMPSAKPPTEDDYLHDISITGLTVQDPDPCAHAWHPSKGDPNKEETHGFDLQYAKRVSVTDCNLLYVGDEAIDICGCYDVIVMNNHVEGCPAAGTAGGAISIGDGCKGVVVSGNTVNGSAPDEVLDDGTILKKSNFGIAVESLFIPVVDVTITGNIVRNIQGNGINLGATNEGSGLTNIIISNNVVDSCCIGIDDEGTYPKQGIKICENLITNTYRKDDDYGHAIRFTNGLKDLTVIGNTIKNIAGDYVFRAVDANSTQKYADNVIDGFDNAVFFGSGDVAFTGCHIANGGRLGQGRSGVLLCTAGDLKVANCTIKNVCNTKGVVGATSVENTDIELINTAGVVTTGEYLQDYSTTTRLRRVIGCRLRGRMSIKKDNAVVQGVIIESDSIGNNAITVSANGVLVTGCVIVTKANNAITETSGYDCNVFANNICCRAIVKTGAHSLSVNNVDLDDMGVTA